MMELALALIVVGLLVHNAIRERDWRKEREGLVQRLQAPDLAARRFEQDRSKRPKRRPPRVLVSDDEAQVEAIRRRESEQETHVGDAD